LTLLLNKKNNFNILNKKDGIGRKIGTYQLFKLVLKYFFLYILFDVKFIFFGKTRLIIKVKDLSPKIYMTYHQLM